MDAVIDRIKKDERKVVLIVDHTEEELIVPIELLPCDAQEGDWVRINRNDGLITDISVDLEKTQSTKKRIQSKLSILKNNSKSQFKVSD